MKGICDIKITFFSRAASAVTKRWRSFSQTYKWGRESLAIFQWHPRDILPFWLQIIRKLWYWETYIIYKSLIWDFKMGRGIGGDDCNYHNPQLPLNFWWWNCIIIYHLAFWIFSVNMKCSVRSLLIALVGVTFVSSVLLFSLDLRLRKGSKMYVRDKGLCIILKMS